MKWDMDIDEIEAVMEKIWDLHDKLSDAIHLISRTHFFNSIKSLKKYDKKTLYSDVVDDNRAGFVFVKGFRVDDNDLATQEAKSLNAIRTTLENLEDQLESLQTVQTQQQAERDAAIARLEQSRIILAMRLAEHHGKKYKVIEEALAFVGDVQDAPENLYSAPVSPSGENFTSLDGRKFNRFINILISSFNFAKSLKLDHMGGILGNAAMVAVSMVALLHLHQLSYKDRPQNLGDKVYSNQVLRRPPHLEISSSNTQLNQLDVLSARG